jgi:hypothetical protein
MNKDIDTAKNPDGNEIMDSRYVSLRQVTRKSNCKKSVVRDAIPKKLNEAILSLGLSKTMTGKAIKLCCIIMKDCFYKKISLTSFIDIPADYFEKIFNKEYHTDFLNQMKAGGIIQCIESYVKGSPGRKGKCKQYRINPTLMDGENVPVTYCEKPRLNRGSKLIAKGPSAKHENESENEEFPKRLSEKTTISSNTPISSSYTSLNLSSSIYHICPRFFDSSLVIDDLRSLHYDEEKMRKANEKYVKSLNKRLICDENIQETYFQELRNNLINSTYEVSKKSALSWAKENKANLIQSGDSFYIDKKQTFLQEKRKSIRIYFEAALTKLKNKTFFATRNEKNRRLDHDLTIAGKHILEVIKKENDLIEIDIRNSQFAIHAFWMKSIGLCEHPDVQRYYEMCCHQGKLYEALAEELKIGRGDAKSMMMELGFSKPGNRFALKKVFKLRFPNVIKHIDDFKTEKGYKEFSNELQQLESEIVVDHLYAAIKAENMFCLTKHDSIIIRKQDERKVLKLIKSCFTELGFECVLKIGKKKVPMIAK